jgi:hypothetical protein
MRRSHLETRISGCASPSRGCGLWLSVSALAPFRLATYLQILFRSARHILPSFRVLLPLVLVLLYLGEAVRRTFDLLGREDDARRRLDFLEHRDRITIRS